ncbi:MAG: hypothetical protein C7B44_05980 [Sulfobacillus thermosulfidooxidans]|nr:MAG: hypothetical protein C7B44_05980 [Sulfobacillus thermosulfidooxidans]
MDAVGHRHYAPAVADPPARYRARSLFVGPVTQLHMQVPVASARALPATSSARQGLVQLERHFPHLDLFPIDVVVESHGTPMASPQNLRQVADMVRVLQRLSTVARVQGPTTWQPQWSVADYVRVYRHWPSLPPLEQQQASAWLSPRHPQVALIAVDSTQSANSLRTHQLVERIRQTLSRMPLQGLTVLVGGQTAVGYDFDQAVTQSFPLMIVVVLGVSGLLLAWTFRSLILPLQALVLNGLVTLASLGVLVAVFQQGLWGLLPAHHTVNSVTPVVLFAVLFGLSMDYEVFIVSRIREKHEAGATTEHSIIAGVSETSRLVTGAAVIMIAVFVAFATVPIGVVQQLGIGLATAIFLDAVIVRTTLVPAVMRLLGERNWWGRRWWNPMSGDSHHNGNTALCPENR